ncbi:hypothetical protein CM15mP35_01260 [bacterium]|nr:MAG: hypothetical protein CM15mP35_01260 [bacterium]
MNWFIKLLKIKIKLLSNGLQNRPFVHIDDINNLVVKSLEENEDKNF